MKLILPQCALNRMPDLHQVIPQTMQVCQDISLPITRFADIGQVHEIEFDDVLQAGPVPRRHVVVVGFGELDFDGQIGPTL